MRTRRLLAVVLPLLGPALALAGQPRRDAFVESREHPAIAYNTTPAHDAIADLNRRLADGSVRFTFDPESGYLRSALEALSVPVESQALVFTPSSLQAPKINARNPRAVFFNDTVSVAWVRGGQFLEVLAQDPRQGAQFYTMDQTASGAPRFFRQVTCLTCHVTWDTAGVPGAVVLTTKPRRTAADYSNGIPVDYRTPIAERWGGWYLTGRRGPAAHFGNLPLFTSSPAPSTEPLPASLEGRFDLAGYPSGHSDIVALMVLEHQARAENLITRLGWEARLGDATRVRDAAGDLVDALLFVNEAPLGSPLEGSSGFAERFAAMGPRDAKGRSLRDLDLQTRLMRYPLSYTIYTPAFDALPAEAGAEARRRLRDVLAGRDAAPGFGHLTPEIRQTIVEILRDTKPDVLGEPAPRRGLSGAP